MGPGAPSATVPVTHTWQATDVPAVYNLAARGRGDGHWYRLLRFGHADNGPYWCRRWPPPGLPPVRIAGGPRQLTAAAVTYKSVLPTWQAHASGRTVTGYRRWPDQGGHPHPDPHCLPGHGGGLAGTSAWTDSLAVQPRAR